MAKTNLTLLMFMVLVFTIFTTLTMTLVHADPIYKQNWPINLQIPCTNNGTYCSAFAVCNATVINPNGTTIRNGASMTQNGSFFNISLSASEVSQAGEYQFTVCCVDGAATNCVDLIFLVNPTGSELSTPQGIIYVIVLILSIFIFLLVLFGAIRIPFKNQRNDYEAVVNINDLKYFKILLIGFSYLLLLWITFLIKGIASNYLFLNGAYNFFNVIFWVLFSALWPGVILSLYITLVLFLNDKKLKDLIERGIPSR